MVPPYGQGAGRSIRHKGDLSCTRRGTKWGLTMRMRFASIAVSRRNLACDAAPKESG
ncbi:hypothetical protein ACFU0W_13040 [Microbacterium keratanolyticum]|uniref:hypothetical protein n=1 Tax=Microbacterium keratanolyticum TaxID=67574 RepID=UPI003626E1FA